MRYGSVTSIRSYNASMNFCKQIIQITTNKLKFHAVLIFLYNLLQINRSTDNINLCLFFLLLNWPPHTGHCAGIAPSSSDTPYSFPFPPDSLSTLYMPPQHANHCCYSLQNQIKTASSVNGPSHPELSGYFYFYVTKIILSCPVWKTT